MAKEKEYFGNVDGSNIDSNGFKGRGVTAWNVKNAISITRKAKKYYGGQRAFVKCPETGKTYSI